MSDVQRLIEQNRQMKMEIHKLQITQYAQSDFDNRSDASQNSFKKSDRFSDTTEIENKVRKISGY